jgi:hypothetical protein
MALSDSSRAQRLAAQPRKQVNRITSRAALGLLALCAALPAQEPGKADDGGYAALAAAYEKARDAYYAGMRELANDPEYKAARAARDTEKTTAISNALRERVGYDETGFVAKFSAGADAHGGTPRAVPFLCWVAGHTGSAEEAASAIDTLIASHVADAAILPAVESPMWAYRGMKVEDAIARFEKIVSGSGHDLVRAWALYGMARVGKRAAGEDAEAIARFDAFLAEAEKLAAGTDLALKIQGPRFQAERLQMGMVAPDIEAADLDGVAFKLSDYRGKVVVLDFWGDW